MKSPQRVTAPRILILEPTTVLLFRLFAAAGLYSFSFMGHEIEILQLQTFVFCNSKIHTYILQ